MITFIIIYFILGIYWITRDDSYDCCDSFYMVDNQLDMDTNDREF